MIVISGALVLVALILLVIGLVSASLTFVYASIAVSVLSFVALIVGVVQRRGQDQAAEGGASVDAEVVPAPQDDVTDVAPVRRPAVVPAVGGEVLVVAGRPRYHVEGCRYLAGKDPESVDVARAVEEGFTACGVCKPDEALAAAASTDAPADETSTDATEALALPDQEAEQAEEAVPARTRRAATAVSRAGQAAPAKAAKATKAPAKAATKAAAKAPAKAATKAPAKAAAKAPARAAAKAPAKAAASAPKRGGVIVIPDRGKFHKADCRYVRGVRGALELTRAQAVKQGYEPCGVCSS